MKENQRSILLNTAIGVVIAAVVVAIEWQYGYSIPRLLTDGFFVAAVILLGLGGIIFAANGGTFDMMGYSMKSFLGIVIPGTRLGDPHDGESFLDYKERKAEKRKSPTALLAAGCFHLAVSMLMMVIFNLMT